MRLVGAESGWALLGKMSKIGKRKYWWNMPGSGNNDIIVVAIENRHKNHKPASMRERKCYQKVNLTMCTQISQADSFVCLNK